MHVVVVGSGVIGMTCSYLLDYHGCQVTVIDSETSYAQKASFQNGGLLCPSQSDSWTYWKNITWNKISSIGFGQDTIEHSRWFVSWLRNCNRDTSGSLRELSNLSMQLFSQPPFNSISSSSYQRVAKGTYDVEKQQLYPEDSNGDIRGFCKEMYLQLEPRVRFRFNTRVKSICVCDNNITGLQVTGPNLEKEIIKGDYYLFATGISTTQILSTIGIYCPILPALGYLVSFTIPHTTQPSINVKYKDYYVSHFPTFLRASAFCDITRNPNISRFKTLSQYIKRDYPNHTITSARHGIRPLSPDDAPYIGKVKPYNNLFVCSGHGSKGWTLATGSAMLLKEQLFGNTLSIRSKPFDPNRFET